MSRPYDASFYNDVAPEYPDAVLPTSTLGGHPSQLSVQRMLLIPTGTYEQQYSRPYATQYSVENKSEIAEILGRTYYDYQQNIAAGRVAGDAPYIVTPELVASSSSSFIGASAKTEAGIEIAQGWGSRRMRFLLVVNAKRPGVGDQTYLLIGYTNYMGVTLQGNVDPNMEFTINAVFETRVAQRVTAFGTENYTVMSNASQVLTNPTFNGDINSNVQHRMRPEDVLAAINISHIPELASGRVEVIDTRSRTSSTPVKSSYGNANPTNYLASVLSGLTTGLHQEQHLNRHGQAYDLGMQSVSESKAIRDPFMRAMSSQNRTALTNTFTWDNLCQLDPNVTRDEVTAVINHDKATLMSAVNRPGENLHEAGRGASASWNATNRNTEVAVKIANSFPHLMVDLLISSVSIHSTNRHSMPNPLFQNKAPDVTVVPAIFGVVPGVDMTPQIDLLIHQWRLNILNDATFGNTISYDISVTADLTGEIWISLNLEGHEPADFVAPAFANSLTSPVATRNLSNLTGVANSFARLQNEVFPTSQGGFKPQQSTLWTPPSGKTY